MEKVDLYNNRKELTGKVAERNKVPEGFYRLSIHVWIMNSKGEILIQKRAKNKKVYPNIWTNTGGAALTGESSLETVFRELKEELDIIPDINNLKLIASFMREKDFVDVWLLEGNYKIKDMHLQKEEVQAVKWVTIKEFIEMTIKKEAFKASFDYLKKYLTSGY